MQHAGRKEPKSFPRQKESGWVAMLQFASFDTGMMSCRMVLLVYLF
jgi:hypothetical protein